MHIHFLKVKILLLQFSIIPLKNCRVNNIVIENCVTSNIR
jgi:hypothetical protein